MSYEIQYPRVRPYCTLLAQQTHQLRSLRSHQGVPWATPSRHSRTPCRTFHHGWSVGPSSTMPPGYSEHRRLPDDSRTRRKNGKMRHKWQDAP